MKPIINRRMNKKGFIPLIIIVVSAVLLVAFGGVILNSLQTGSLVGGSQFAKPLWARLECAPTDAYEGTTSSNIQATSLFNLGANTIFKCDGFTDQCEVTLNGKTGANYKLCDLNGNNCESSTTVVGIRQLPNIPGGKEYIFTTSMSGPSYSAQWKPWKLYRFYGGAKDIVNSFDCSIRSGDLSKIRAGDKVDRLFFVGGPGQKWINYVDDWAYGPATNIVTYNGQQAYCSGAKVYSIVNLAMADGSLVPLDPSYKAETPSGDSISGLGSIISNVECCPNEPNCGSDFKFKPAGTPETGVAQCFSDTQCFNAGGPVPTDGFHYIKYTCTSGKCAASSPIAVDCTSNANCPSGSICDLSTMNYGKCIKQIARFCGDGVCDSAGGEAFSNCPADCALACADGQTLVTKYQNGGALCLFGYVGLCSQTGKTQYCSSGTPWYYYLAWALVIAALIVVFWFGRPYIIPALSFVKMYWWILLILLFVGLLIYGGLT